MADNFGSQFVVVAIDARGDENDYWTVTVNGGRIPTDKELFSWAKEAEERGAGEILFTSMNHDGTKKWFCQQAVSKNVGDVKNSNYRIWRCRENGAFCGCFHRRESRCRARGKHFSL